TRDRRFGCAGLPTLLGLLMQQERRLAPDLITLARQELERVLGWIVPSEVHEILGVLYVSQAQDMAKLVGEGPEGPSLAPRSRRRRGRRVLAGAADVERGVRKPPQPLAAGQLPDKVGVDKVVAPILAPCEECPFLRRRVVRRCAADPQGVTTQPLVGVLLVP